MAKRMREMSKPVVPLLVLRGIERSQSWVPGNIHFGQVQGVLRIEACTMVPCMEAVEDVVALRSKLLQGGRAAASAPGGAVAHEAGEHASIVVDNKLHVAARANVSEQAADLCARLATSTSRHMADCTAGQNKGQDATGPASTQSWQRLRQAAGVEVTLGKHPRRVRGRRPAGRSTGKARTTLHKAGSTDVIAAASRACVESDAHRQSSRAQIAGVRKAVRKDSLCGKGVLQMARGKGGRGYERSRWSMTSAEGTSWARHFGATEIHGQANTCIVARTAGDIGAEAHAEIDFVVHAHTANLRAGGANVLPTVALEEGLLHEHSQARQNSSIVRSGAQAASNSASIRTQKVIRQQHCARQ